MFDFVRFKNDYLLGGILEKQDKLLKQLTSTPHNTPEGLTERTRLRKEIQRLPSSQEEASTLYCSTIAHLRGKLHTSRVRAGTLSLTLKKPIYYMQLEERSARLIDKTRQIYTWTIEDQGKLVADLIQLYQKKLLEEAAQLSLPASIA